MHVYIVSMYICTYVCKHHSRCSGNERWPVHMCMRMRSICMRVCMHVCVVLLCMYVYIVCMYVCMYVYMYASKSLIWQREMARTYVYKYVTHIYTETCMHAYIHMVHAHTCIHTSYASHTSWYSYSTIKHLKLSSVILLYSLMLVLYHCLVHHFSQL